MSPDHRTALATSSLLATLMLAGCSTAAPWSGEVPAPDYQTFAETAYPVMLRDCAFSECHGNNSRFFQVWGPGRTRIDPLMKIDDPVTPLEIQISYERARSMLVAERPDAKPLLLVKPLEEDSGGTGHEGMDAFGRNVYQTAGDPNYLVIVQWARSLAAPVLPQPLPGQAPAPVGGSL